MSQQPRNICPSSSAPVGRRASRPLRVVLLLAACAACQFGRGADAAPVGAVEVVQDMNFSTAGQSIWSPGTATVEQEFRQFLGTSWDQSNLDVPVDLPGFNGFVSGHLSEGRAGLEAIAQLTSGSVDVNYPTRVTYRHPAKYEPGQQVVVSTHLEHLPGAQLSTLGPAAQFKLDAVIDARFSFGAGGDAFDGLDAFFTGADPETVIDDVVPQAMLDRHRHDITLIDTGGEVRRTLVTIGSGAAGISLPFGNLGGVSANVPEPLNLSTNAPDAAQDLSVSGSANPPFLALTADVDGILTTLANSFGVPIPPLSGDYDLGFGTLSYDIVDVSVSGGPKFYQAFDFDFKKLDVTLTANTGEVRHGKAGDAFSFTAPADGELQIDARVSIDHLFSSDTGFVLGASAGYAIGSGSASILGFQIGSFGPLAEDTVSIGETGPVILLPKQFALQGFPTYAQELRILPVPEPTTVVVGGIATLLLLVASRRRCVRAKVSRVAPAAVAALAASVLFSNPAGAGSITAIHVFGDSLSDTGNVLKVTKETKNPFTGDLAATPRPDNPWYDAGRWTNGTSNDNSKTVNPKTKESNYGGVWHERLADKLKIKRATNSLAGGDNWAYGGATTAAGTFSLLRLQNIGEQVQQFLAREKDRQINDSELFAVWGGGNDVRNAAVAGGATVKSITQAATTALANIKQVITDLAKRGAKRFLWPNLPPLEKTPEARGKDFTDIQRDGLKQASQQFRDQQKQAVAMIKKANPGLKIEVLDIHGEFLKILEKPADFGLTNVTENIIVAGDFSAATFSPVSNPKFADTQVDADKFLFWDEVHPTARAHELIAMKASSRFIPEPEAWALLVVCAAAAASRRQKSSMSKADF